jgi:pyrroline-5-carboxylate reductase
MLFIQGLIEAGEAAGLSADTAKSLAVQTATGAAQLVSCSELPLQTLINNVTSPNGTTEKALLSFKESNLKGIVSKAFDAAKNRSEELAKELA